MYIYRFLYLCLEHLFPKSKINRFYDSWLICDRPLMANDNGEHLYRYIKNHHPEVKIFFLLSRESKDWERLSREGFELIEYGSATHRKALKVCSKLISSQADNCIVNHFGEHTDWKKEFVFLQHGVLMNDLSNWLNFKRIALIVTTTRPEFQYLTSKASPFLFKKNQVKLLGLPRHDRLIEINDPKPVILVAPTWRKYLKFLSKQSIEHDIFITSWRDFLNGKRLKQMIKKYGYKVTFYPHPLLSEYIKYFNLPDFIEVGDDVQKLISEASCLLTDYSSLSFEMGLLKKAVIYYQFDRENIYSSSLHTFRQGYFSYELNGFGEVVYSLEELENSIERMLKSDCSVSDDIKHRMYETFPYRDKQNCKRVFEAILSL